MKIGLDIDNVIANTFHELSSHFNDFMGRKFEPHEIVLEMRKHKLKMVFYNIDAWLKGVLGKVSPVKEAIISIREWNKEHKIQLITSRLFILKRQTEKWLKKHDIPYNELYHLKEGTKYKKAKECDIFIEDNLEECEILSNYCKTVFLMDYPWNRKPLRPKNIIRILTWDEIKEFIARSKDR